MIHYPLTKSPVDICVSLISGTADTVSTMFGFLISLSSPGSILADQKYLIPVFVTVFWFSKILLSTSIDRIPIFLKRFR